MGKQDIRLPRGQSQYMVVGRFVPNQKYTESHPQCKVYRMKLFAKNAVVARSRYWYFMKKLTRVKKANGQIISVNQARLSPARQPSGERRLGPARAGGDACHPPPPLSGRPTPVRCRARFTRRARRG